MSDRSKGIARHASLIGAATMVSRVLGLVRELLLAVVLGAGHLSDAFRVAFRIPNFLRDLFAEGVFAQAFVPTFKKELVANGKATAYRFANRVLGTLIFVIVLLLVLAFIFAPQIVDFLASSYRETEGKFELTVLLTRILLPFLLLISVAALCMGVLNAQDHYGPPAFAPALFNVVSIVGAFLLLWLRPEDRWLAIGWAIAALVGVLAQVLIQVPRLVKLGFRMKPHPDPLFKSPELRKVIKLMAPAVVGLAAMQVNLVVNTIFASQQEGAVSWLSYAFRFLQLPIGVFGVAIATVMTTRVADTSARKDHSQTAIHLQEGLRLVMVLTVPAAVGLVLLSEPIISLVFEHGRFTWFDTVATASALRYYMIGLTAYAAVKVVAPTFYAYDQVKLPMIASVVAVAINIAINVGLYPIYGFRVLAFGTAIAAVINFLLLYLFVSARVVKLDHKSIASCLVKVAIATGVMAAATYVCYDLLRDQLHSRAIWARGVIAMVPIMVALPVYGIMAKLLRIEEVTLLATKIAARLRKK